MSEGWIHPLRQWRKDRELTLDACAASVGTFRQTWLDWETERRIPNRTYMPRIFTFTRGEISANTMYFPHGLPDFETPMLPLDEQGDTPLLDSLAA